MVTIASRTASASALLAGGELGILAGTHSLDCGIDGNGVLLRIGDAGNAADRIGMTLAYALAPEGVVGAIRQEAVAHHAVQAEQARVPTAADQRQLAAFAGSRVDGGEVSGDVRVVVEAVDHVVLACICGGHLGQVGRAAAAQDQDIDAVNASIQIGSRANRNALGCDLKVFGVAAGEHADQFHVGILGNRHFHTTAQVAVAQDAYADLFHFFHLSYFPAASAQNTRSRPRRSPLR